MTANVPKRRRMNIVRRTARRHPGERMLLSFIVIILVGTFLLLLPVSSTDGHAGFLRSLFSAASATCVTGLVVVDTGTYWTLFGQIVILLLIQIGGLSYMVMTTMVISAFRRRQD